MRATDFYSEEAWREAMDGDQLATPTDACREFARNVGGECPDRAWILTDYDTWQANPHYRGPAVPHPECDEYDAADYEDECEAEDGD